MAPFKCFDILEQVLDNEKDHLEQELIVDDVRYDNVIKFCAGIDSIIDRFSGTGISAEVDQDMMIHITIETDDIVIRKGETQFYELMDHSAAVRFFSSDENNLCIEYVLEGIWKEKEV